MEYGNNVFHLLTLGLQLNFGHTRVQPRITTAFHLISAPYMNRAAAVGFACYSIGLPLALVPRCWPCSSSAPTTVFVGFRWIHGRTNTVRSGALLYLTLSRTPPRHSPK